jgi:hypothetical protein
LSGSEGIAQAVSLNDHAIVLMGDLACVSSRPWLPGAEERFVLLAMHQTLVERGLSGVEDTTTFIQGQTAGVQANRPR